MRFRETDQADQVATGALDAGSITAGFGAIDNGTSNIRSATITAETAFVPDTAGGAALGTTALEFSDLFLTDAGAVKFGADQDVTLTHVVDSGLLLNGTMQLQFNDASQFINGQSNAILGINATDEIELNATLIDINGKVDIADSCNASAFSGNGQHVTAVNAVALGGNDSDYYRLNVYDSAGVLLN